MTETLTLTLAMKRHPGMCRRQWHLMMLKGEIKAKKVGKLWIIPVAELDRIFKGE